MATYYKVNKNLKRERIKNWRKNNKLWKLAFPLLIMGVIICLAIFIGVFTLIVKESNVNKTSNVSIILIGCGFACICTLIPSVILQDIWRRIRIKTAEPYENYANEYVQLTDDEIIFMYHPSRKQINNLTEYRIPYDRINHIHLDNYYILSIRTERLESTQYTDFTNGIINNQRIIENIEVQFMLYFDEEQKLISELTEKSGLVVIRTDVFLLH